MKKINFKNYKKGAATLELLIAFTVLILNITAITLIVSGSQSLSTDSETSVEAFSKTKAMLEKARADSRQNFNLVNSLPVSPDFIQDGIYKKILTVSDLTQCKKQITSTVTWSVSPIRPQKTELATFITDITETLALGGDCITNPPVSNWNNPKLFASETMTSKPTAIDVLNKIAYISIEEAPFLAIADTRNAILGQNSGLFVAFSNGFSAGAKINALDAIYDPVTKKHYVFAAMNTPTDQLKVIDVTDISKPILVASRTLPNITNGIARSIFYYDKKIYIGTQYVVCNGCVDLKKNNELHIYDVSGPTNPVWEGSFKANSNVNAIAVRGKYTYLATSGENRELIILDISNPASITQVSVFNATGGEDGMSLYLLGNKIFLGRIRTPSTRPDFYILNISNPAIPTEFGSKNLGLLLGTAVIEIRVSGKFIFLVLSDETVGFQVLDILNLPTINTVSTFNSYQQNTGIDYNPDFIYTIGRTTPYFRMIYSPL